MRGEWDVARPPIVAPGASWRVSLALLDGLVNPVHPWLNTWLRVVFSEGGPMQLGLDAMRVALHRLQLIQDKHVNPRISPADDMYDHNNPAAYEHYLTVGRDAIRVICTALVLCRKTEIRSILDLPCGYGRVMRYLRVAFPDALITGCDLAPDKVAFCHEFFGSIGVESKEDFPALQFDAGFDLIWSGSLLTHLPLESVTKAIALFRRSLNPGGVAVFTVHGRHSLFAQHHKFKYLPAEQFEAVKRGYYADGFGYAGYPAGHSAATEQLPRYGISVCAPWFVIQKLVLDDSVRVVSYCERGWDNHQDVVVIQNVAVNAD